MKASELRVKPISIKKIYEDIKLANERGEYKWFIPHMIKVSNETQSQLISDGFKVYIGDWDGYLKNAFIIEW